MVHDRARLSHVLRERWVRNKIVKSRNDGEVFLAQYPLVFDDNVVILPTGKGTITSLRECTPRARLK